MPTTPPSEPLAFDASLHLLADHLLDGLAEGELDPCLLHVDAVDEVGFDLGVRPLDGEHPGDLLRGFTAPDRWQAVGVATGGLAHRLSDRADDHPDPEPTRVLVVTLLSRSGELAHRARSLGADVPGLGADGPTPSGEQVDLLRRCLGLPTEAPPQDTAAWWSALWLATLVDPAQPVAVGLDDAFARHPAARLLDRGAVEPLADRTVVLRAFHRVLSWHRIRALVSDGCLAAPDCTSHEAGWMDDGAFARHLLARCAPLPRLRRRLRDRLGVPTATAVLGLLDEVGVPHLAWPDVDPAGRAA